MNKIIKQGYKTLTYFEIGKAFIGRFYQIIPDAIIMVGGIKYLVGLEVGKNFLPLFLVCMVLIIYFTGLVLKLTRLYDTEMKVKANINPVEAKLLKAAKIIIDKNGKV
jgi:hypothetical protein